MKRLEVGDEVVFDGFYGYYSIEKVVSVTNKRAKLSDRTVLVREQEETETFTVYGKTYRRGAYRQATPELKAKLEERSKKCEYESRIEKWFKSFNPDFATKESLYKQFNPQINE